VAQCRIQMRQTGTFAPVRSRYGGLINIEK
jgi:hypothetical protein